MRVLFLALLLAGCASTTDVITRTSTDTPPDTAQGLLIAAKSPEESARETWEMVCKPIFEKAGLNVALGHQEVPLWQQQGRRELVRWADSHQTNRVLIVDLTMLLISPPNMRAERSLNPINQDTEVQPTWEIGTDGERIRRQPPADPEQEFPSDLLGPGGDVLWHGVARTHEANDQTAIAKSQCRALRDTLREADLL